MISIISFISLLMFVLPTSKSTRRVSEPLLNTNDLINIYGIELVRRRAVEDYENTIDDLDQENTGEDGADVDYDEAVEQSMTPYDETSELPTSTDDDDDQDMRSETFSPVFTTSNYELGETFVFLNNLLDGFLWEYENYYADKIIFKSDIMTWFYIYTSINLEQEKIHWVEGTGCTENYTTRNDRIIRKIKYNPILIDLRISNTVCEFDVIRANYFCYTYVEMVYILNFGYNIPAILNKEEDYIFTSYLNVEYLVAGSSINDSPIDIYFCNSSNYRCRTVFSRANINKMQLSSRNKKNNVLVKDKKMLLDLLKDFKTCEVCGRRLQIWIGEQELGKIYEIIGSDLSLMEVNDQIFDTINVF